MTEQEKKELLDELEKRMDEKYKGCLTREDVATTLKAPREKWFRDENGNEKIIDGDIHLDGVNVNRWIEISKETLEKHFEEVEP